MEACGSDIPASDPGAVGGTGEIVDQPDAEGINCGVPGEAGWAIECSVPEAGAIGYLRDGEWVVQRSDETLTDYFGGGVCCEGCGGPTDACRDLCARFFCEQARKWHNDNNGPCQDCAFDLSGCIGVGNAGDETELWVTQHQLPSGTIGYNLQVACEDVQAVWVDNLPNGDVCADPGFLNSRPFCMNPEEVDLSPNGKLTDHQTVEDAGTVAELAWSWDLVSGVERSADAEVKLDYSLGPCATVSGDCLTLARLEASSTDTVWNGIAITEAKLIVTSQLPDSLRIDARGRFSVTGGALEAVVTFFSDGIPVIASVANAGVARGSADPASGSLTLYGLEFPFDRFGLSASVRVDLSAQYVARPPNAAISIADTPPACADPVAFRALANDPDGGTLHHIWTADGAMYVTGELLEHVFTAGPHVVTLTTVDDSGRVSGDSLEFARRCD